MFQGSDVDGLEKVGMECEKAADIADTVRKACMAIVAASWVFGPFGGAFTSYLATVVIPWLGRISTALHLFAKVLAGHADAQRRVSSGESVDFSTLPTYQSQAMPEGDTRQYPVLPEGQAGSGGGQAASGGGGGTGSNGGAEGGGSGGGQAASGGGGGTGSSGGLDGGSAGAHGSGGAHGEGPHLPTIDRPIVHSGVLDRETLRDTHHEDFAHGGGTPTSHSTSGGGGGSRTSTSGDPGRDGHVSALGGTELIDRHGALWSARGDEGKPGEEDEIKIGFADADVDGMAGWNATTGMGAGIAAAGAVGLIKATGKQRFELGHGMTLDTKEEAAIQARAQGEAFTGVYRRDGHTVIGANAGIDAFAGAEVAGGVSVGNDLVRAGVEGRLQAGAGIAGGYGVTYDNGHLRVGSRWGVTWGYGGKVNGYVDVNVGELASRAYHQANEWLRSAGETFRTQSGRSAGCLGPVWPTRAPIPVGAW
jgi:hypothetical protein